MDKENIAAIVLPSILAAGQPTRILFGDNLAVAWIGVRQTMCTADM